MTITTLQTILDFASCAGEHPEWSQNAIEDYMGKAFDINTVVALINDGNLSPQTGSGSPEGLIVANYSLMYVDTDVPTLYFNPVFEATTGWVTV